jgi:hypothetical protein
VPDIPAIFFFKILFRLLSRLGDICFILSISHNLNTRAGRKKGKTTGFDVFFLLENDEKTLSGAMKMNFGKVYKFGKVCVLC